MSCERASKKENKKRFSLGLHLFITYLCSKFKSCQPSVVSPQLGLDRLKADC